MSLPVWLFSPLVVSPLLFTTIAHGLPNSVYLLLLPEQTRVLNTPSISSVPIMCACVSVAFAFAILCLCLLSSLHARTLPHCLLFSTHMHLHEKNGENRQCGDVTSLTFFPSLTEERLPFPTCPWLGLPPLNRFRDNGNEREKKRQKRGRAGLGTGGGGGGEGGEPPHSFLQELSPPHTHLALWTATSSPLIPLSLSLHPLSPSLCDYITSCFLHCTFLPSLRLFLFLPYLHLKMHYPMAAPTFLITLPCCQNAKTDRSCLSSSSISLPPINVILSGQCLPEQTLHCTACSMAWHLIFGHSIVILSLIPWHCPHLLHFPLWVG